MTLPQERERGGTVDYSKAGDYSGSLIVSPRDPAETRRAILNIVSAFAATGLPEEVWIPRARETLAALGLL